MLRFFSSDKWSGWQVYITLTSTGLACLGVYFGALVPFVEWLDAKRALAWVVSFSLAFLILLGLVIYSGRSRASSGSIFSFAPKIVLFGFLWSSFPYLLCSSSVFFPSLGKTASCQVVPLSVEIAIRKHGNSLKLVSLEPFEEILERTRAGRPLEPVLRHPDDINRVLVAMQEDKVNKEVSDFLKSWVRRENEIKTTIVRFVAAFSASPLAPSDYSERYVQRVRFQLSDSDQRGVLLEGDEALGYLRALVETGTNYQPIADDAIKEALELYLVAALTKQYYDLRYIPNHYVSSIDTSLTEFILSIPPGHKETIKSLLKSPNATEFIEFECGSSRLPDGTTPDSRFIVNVDDVDSPEAIHKMKNGPWPIGSPSEFFSEEWWLKHAIWQMLARESRHYLDSLPMRLSDYSVCGPP